MFQSVSTRVYFKIPGLPPQNSRWQHENRANQSKHSLDRNTHQPERQHQQPDDGVKKQEGNSERPAKDQEDEPEEDAHEFFNAKVRPTDEVGFVPRSKALGIGFLALGDTNPYKTLHEFEQSLSQIDAVQSAQIIADLRSSACIQSAEDQREKLLAVAPSLLQQTSTGTRAFCGLAKELSALHGR